MHSKAEKFPLFEWSDTAAVSAQAAILRAVIAAIPEPDRAAVFAQLKDLIPSAMPDKRRAPQRGGDVLNNVFQLFQKAPEAVLAAGEIRAELSKAGADVEPQAVRNALNYLNGRCVLRRVGYGRYQLADGRIVDGPP